MNQFQNDLQQLSVSQFQSGEMTPWNQQGQYPGVQYPNGVNQVDPSRQCIGFGGFCVGFCGGFCVGACVGFCGGCGGFRCGGCGGFRCGGFRCGGCGGFHRCR